PADQQSNVGDQKSTKTYSIPGVPPEQVVPPFETEDQFAIDPPNEEAKDGHHDPFDFQAKEQAIDKDDVESSAALPEEGEEEQGKGRAHASPILQNTIAAEDFFEKIGIKGGRETLFRDAQFGWVSLQ